VSDKILILGGTKEAAELAKVLTAAGHQTITSLAGRTREPRPVAGTTRIGGFGGAEKLAKWIEDNNITRIIDATHPFATKISRNAKTASEISGVNLERRTRQPWQQVKGDIWHQMETLEQAAQVVPANARVLLALGSQYLSAFATRQDVHFVVRMVDSPETPPELKSHELVLGRPSVDWIEEAEMLKQHGITHIVCRNSGGSGAFAKIVAARELAIPVIIIKMPQ
jgi:precorrin-6A/cobalt-precorrin-6A reductase